MIYTIDGWIVNKFERFSHWTQRTFGLTSQPLRRLAITAEMCSLGVYCVNHYDFTTVSYPLLLFFGGLEYAYSFYEEKTLHHGTANPKKASPHPRVFYLLIVFFLLILGRIGSPTNPWFAFAAIAMYFAACDDLPPGESRVRQFLNSLRQSRAGLVGA